MTQQWIFILLSLPYPNVWSNHLLGEHSQFGREWRSMTKSCMLQLPGGKLAFSTIAPSQPSWPLRVQIWHGCDLEKARSSFFSDLTATFASTEIKEAGGNSLWESWSTASGDVIGQIVTNDLYSVIKINYESEITSPATTNLSFAIETFLRQSNIDKTPLRILKCRPKTCLRLWREQLMKTIPHLDIPVRAGSNSKLVEFAA